MKIKFSHNYPKLHGQTSAELLAVRHIRIDENTPRELLESAETKEDIIAEIRDAMTRVGCFFSESVEEWCDRFEAAFKRESAGNVAAMRDALVSIAKVPVPHIRIRVSSPGPGIIIHEPEPESEWLAMLRECVKRANAALSAAKEGGAK